MTKKLDYTALCLASMATLFLSASSLKAVDIEEVNPDGQRIVLYKHPSVSLAVVRTGDDQNTITRRKLNSLSTRPANQSLPADQFNFSARFWESCGHGWSATKSFGYGLGNTGYNIGIGLGGVAESLIGIADGCYGTGVGAVYGIKRTLGTDEDETTQEQIKNARKWNQSAFTRLKSGWDNICEAIGNIPNTFKHFCNSVKEGWQALKAWF
jgi:hypothetical protein